jgi:hypothetical protein
VISACAMLFATRWNDQIQILLLALEQIPFTLGIGERLVV